MINETYEIGDATFEVFIVENPDDAYGDKKRPFVIICPGGGYHLIAHREGECIATMFNANGINAGVLHYSVAPSRFPKALSELAEATALVRQHAEEWRTPDNQIAVCGFSAGGHLAASLATMWNDDWLDEVSGTTAEQRRPNALLACYAVLTSGEHAHRGTITNLLGECPSRELLERNSPEKRVGKDTPPTFIWHTWTDKVVPVENALLFAEALRKNDIECEMHVYGYGEHGLGLATRGFLNQKHPVPNPDVSRWPVEAVSWINRIFGRTN